MGRTYAIVACVLSLIAVPAIAGVMVYIPVSWNPVENKTTYNLYLSNTQGQYGNRPFARITRDVSDTAPLVLKLPVTTGSRTFYIGVKAQNENGESGLSNELKVRMVFEVTDVP